MAVRFRTWWNAVRRDGFVRAGFVGCLYERVELNDISIHLFNDTLFARDFCSQHRGICNSQTQTEPPGCRLYSPMSALPLSSPSPTTRQKEAVSHQRATPDDHMILTLYYQRSPPASAPTSPTRCNAASRAPLRTGSSATSTTRKRPSPTTSPLSPSSATSFCCSPLPCCGKTRAIATT